MENNELFQQVKSDVFLRLGIKLSDQDPIFAMVMANQAVMKTFSDPIVTAVEGIPEALDGSLNIIASAVEEAEKTAIALMAETKGVMVALSKLEVEAAHNRIVDAVEQSVGTVLGRVKADVSALETKIKSLGSSFRDTKSMTVSIVLACVVGLLLLLFSAGTYVLYDVGIESRKTADFWQKEFAKQQKVINSLPPSVRKQFD
jgi:uncharacterized protein (DUF1501 family)